MSKENDPKPKIYRGDYVGIDSVITKGKTVNGWAVSEPYIVKGEWHITLNSSRDRFDSWWANRLARNDMNLPCKYVYLIERNNSKARIKEFIVEKFKVTPKAIIAGIIAIFVILFIASIPLNYNDMVRARNQVNNKFSGIDVIEQKRFDKITMLTNATTGSQIQEQEVFKSIADGRKTYTAPGATEEQKTQASQQMSSNILQLPKLLQEQYPTLASNDNVKTAMSEMIGIETELGTARKDYNDTATNYNTNIQSFPKFVFAGPMGFKDAPLYKNDAAADKAPNTDNSQKLRPQTNTVPSTTNNASGAQ